MVRSIKTLTRFLVILRETDLFEIIEMFFDKLRLNEELLKRSHFLIITRENLHLIRRIR